MCKIFRMCFLVAVAVLMPTLALAVDDPNELGREGWPPHLRLLTGPNGGQWFMMGDPIAEALSRAVLPTSSRMGGGVDNISSVSNKNGDVGFTLSCFLGAADSGEAEYQKLRAENTILMANVYPQVLYFLLRKDFAEKHDITDVESLLKKRMPLRFASLRPGTASEFILSLLLKYGYNTSFKQLEGQGWSISFNNYAETADNFVDGELDCFAYTAGTVVPLIKTMEEHTEVRILPISQQVLDMLSAKFKTSTYVIQPGTYQSVTAPLYTLGDYTSLVVRKDLPEDLVYAINKALWDNKSYVSGVIEDFGKLSPDTALPADLPHHPGSARFWNSLAKGR